jgi:hypothetical protein
MHTACWQSYKKYEPHPSWIEMPLNCGKMPMASKAA